LSTRVLCSVLTDKIIVLTALVQRGAEKVQVANMAPSGGGGQGRLSVGDQPWCGALHVRHREMRVDQLVSEVKQEQSENQVFRLYSNLYSDRSV